MNSEKEEVRIAGLTLRKSRHICALFNSRDEQYRVLMPYIREGFAKGDLAFHIIDEGLRSDHEKRLRAEGIDVDDAGKRGQLEVHGWMETYLRSGRFDIEGMLTLVDGAFAAARSKPYPMMRCMANMEWALLDRPGVQDLAEYESRVNREVRAEHGRMYAGFE